MQNKYRDLYTDIYHIYFNLQIYFILLILNNIDHKFLYPSEENNLNLQLDEFKNYTLLIHYKKILKLNVDFYENKINKAKNNLSKIKENWNVNDIETLVNNDYFITLYSYNIEKSSVLNEITKAKELLLDFEQ